MFFRHCCCRRLTVFAFAHCLLSPCLFCCSSALLLVGCCSMLLLLLFGCWLCHATPPPAIFSLLPCLIHTFLNRPPRPHAPADCHHHHWLIVAFYAHQLCLRHRLCRAPSPAAVSTLSPPSLTRSSIARRVRPVRHRRLIVAFKAVATTAMATMLLSSSLRSSPPCCLPPLPFLPHLPLNRPPGPPAPTGCHHCWLIVISLIAGGARVTILSSSSSGFAAHSSPLLSPPSPLTSLAHPSIACRVLPIELMVIF
jgi:hypothetical protein